MTDPGRGAGEPGPDRFRVRMPQAMRVGFSGARRELQTAVIALLASIAIGSVLMLVAGVAPGHVWWAMVTRTAGDPYLLGQVLYRATGLTLTGLAVSLALDAGLFNIGGEAQVTAGVLGCALVGTALPAGTPAMLAIPACVIAAAAAGGAIGGAIGGLRVWRGAHEVITSIMLNAIVAGFALYLGNRVIFRNGTTTGAAIIGGAELPQLGLGGSSANASIALAALAVIVVWWLRGRTAWGQAWRAVGQSPEAARTTGIAVGKVQIQVMVGSGALAGLAATNFVMGHKHAFEEGLGRGVGLLGISAALLGRMHPVGVALAALVLGFLSSGGLAVADLVPKELTEMLQGVVVLAVAAAVPWVRRAEAAA
jgi:simple sugar transport system permease protein